MSGLSKLYQVALPGIVAASLFLTGCASLLAGDAEQDPAFAPAPAGESGHELPAPNRIYGSAQAAQNFLQTLLWDPFLRPFSTASALGSITLKTGGATTRRVVVTHDSPVPWEPLTPVLNQAPMDIESFEQRLDAIVGKSRNTGRIRFLIGGEEFFPRLRDAIDAADDKIHVRTYIFDNDDVSVDIGDQLRERSNDVEVRVLLDGVGTLLGTQVHPESLPAGFEPPPSMTRYLEKDSGINVRTHSNPLMTGDHVKSTIIDGKLAFVGGMNIGREYRYEWHDVMMEVTGTVVNEIQRDADKAWAKAGLAGDFAQFWQTLKPRKKHHTDDGYPIRVLYTLPHDSQIYRAQLAAIRRARNYIYIENAYFSDDIILQELIDARQRGVDVRVIIPEKGNHPMMNLSNETAVNHMIKHGIRVYLYPGMTHVKAAIFDGWACVGSANLDAMSLRINREMNLATADPATVERLRQRLFEKDFAISREVTEPSDLGWRHSLAELIADAAL
jgi:cardiolipin synthase